MSRSATADTATFIDDAFAAHDIAFDHADAALAEAAAWREHDGIDDPTLIDLTRLPFVTIDNDDSRDLDQALHIDRDGDDYRIRYALADASYYVRTGSALFEDALSRGSSYYMPTRVAPMLPARLSEDLVSLEPGKQRRAVVFDMRLDMHGNTLDTQVIQARIHSRAQLSYRGVQAWHDGEEAAMPADAPWCTSLNLLFEIGRKLALLGRERGVVSFDRRETDVVVEGRPERLVAKPRARLDVEQWNAEVSLLCNREGARLLAALDAIPPDSGLEPIYRVHDAPLAGRLRTLRKQIDAWVELQNLETPGKGGRSHWRWRTDQTLADYIDTLTTAATSALDRGRLRAIQRQVLVLQRASEFRAEPGRHHALAVDGYARFSSPMREIVGIFTHKELLESLTGESAPDPALRDAVIASANAARRRQKALDKAIGFRVIADLLNRDLNRDPNRDLNHDRGGDRNGNPDSNPVPRHRGTVLGVKGQGRRSKGRVYLYIGIDDLALDLKVYAEDLARRYASDYTFADFTAVADDPRKPTFVLGDAVDVRAVGFDDERQRFMLDVALRGEAARRERRRARQA